MISDNSFWYLLFLKIEVSLYALFIFLTWTNWSEFQNINKTLVW